MKLNLSLFTSFNSAHKASLITFFLGSSIALMLFNVAITNNDKVITEQFYQIQDIIKEKAPLEKNDKTIPKNAKQTNQAFNKAAQPKHFAQAYKPISPPKDVEYTNDSRRLDGKTSNEKSASNSASNLKMDNTYLTAYNSVNNILSKRSKSIKANSKAVANTNSSIHYSLKNRTHNYLPIPVYLCETNGKIIVNITVNAYGKVTRASINSSSTSFNDCLVNHALEYAKEAHFNASEKNAQIGTITFQFKGK